MVHVDVSKAEEVADTVMGLILGLLKRTHSQLRGGSAPCNRSAAECGGAGICIWASRILAFKMSVLSSLRFPTAARRMDTLNDLLAASNLISLHCALTNDTMHIINADCLQHIKSGAFLVNTGSSQLLEDCAVKQLLIDGTLVGCALDGAERPQWMEAWDAVSDEEDEVEQEDKYENNSPALACETSLKDSVDDRLTEEIQLVAKSSKERLSNQTTGNSSHNQDYVLSQSTSNRSETQRSRLSKKAKKRHGCQKSQNKADNFGKESTSYREEDGCLSGCGQVLSSSSHFASPDNLRSRKTPVESSTGNKKKSGEVLKEGYIVVLHARDGPDFQLHVSKQGVKGGGCFLDKVSNVSKRYPSCAISGCLQKSFTAGGKLLQMNKRMEFVFSSHSFDVWESWTIEGSFDECRLVNCKNPLAALDVRIEIVVAVDEDGVTRWLD
ncbi:2-hydroxyacid dehydrogenase, partial [Striga asiatica]